MATDVPAHVDEFLRGDRLGHLVYAGDPWPNAYPLWYQWTGEAIEFFTRPGRPKVKRLAENPKASVVVSGEFGEPAFWVAIDGDAVIDDDAAEMVHAIAGRYCDLSKQADAELHAEITGVAETMKRVTITPQRVRYFKG